MYVTSYPSKYYHFYTEIFKIFLYILCVICHFIILITVAFNDRRSRRTKIKYINKIGNGFLYSATNLFLNFLVKLSRNFSHTICMSDANEIKGCLLPATLVCNVMLFFSVKTNILPFRISLRF